uniref:Uncharacterized protein n=1 Tax=Anguilla anguilla TaxID=7936 RepID=A0A0E9PTE1_ANGAN
MAAKSLPPRKRRFLIGLEGLRSSSSRKLLRQLAVKDR